MLKCTCRVCGYISRLCRIKCRVSRCICKSIGAHAMRLDVLPGVFVYMNVSASGTNLNILRHTYQRIQVATWFCRLHGLCVLKVSTSNFSIVVVNCHNSRNVQFIFHFWSFENSERILRNQKLAIGLDSYSRQFFIWISFGYISVFVSTVYLKFTKLQYVFLLLSLPCHYRVTDED